MLDTVDISDVENNVLVLGIAGIAGSGKDTLASYLINKYGDNTVCYRSPFAKPIKDACRIIFGWDDRHLYGELKNVVDPKYNVTPRRAMQTLGTEWGRDTINTWMWCIRQYQEFNINFLPLVHEKRANMRSLYLIPDLRFDDSEVPLVKKMNGRIIKIQCDKSHIEMDNDATKHGSEQGISIQNVDYVIPNNTTLSDFYHKIDSVIDDLM